MSSIINKISIKNVVGAIDSAALPKTGVKPLMRVVGVVTGIQTCNSQYGEWVVLKGNFKATNIESGDEFASNKALIQDTLTDAIVMKLSDENAKSVEFAADIGVKKAKNAIGYEYTVTTLREISESDPLAALDESLPKLPSPKKK